MELTINPSDFHPQSLTITCPHCQQIVPAVIINEYDFYTELYHNDPECRGEWTFSTYEQCKAAQGVHEQELFEKENVHSLSLGEKAESRIFGATVTASGWLLGGVIGYFAAKALNFFLVSKADDLTLYHKKLRATLRSYNISHFFKNMPNHLLDSEFLAEQKVKLKEFDELNTHETLHLCA